MSIIETDFCYYPFIKHPLVSEKKLIKDSYWGLLQYFCKELGSQDIFTSMRFRRYKNDYFADNNSPSDDYTNAAKQVLGTHFVPFSFFSYRYVFVFDCIYLLAYDDYEKAKAICVEVKKYISRRYHNTLDNLVEDLFFGKPIVSHYPMITEEMLDNWNSLQEYRSTSVKKVIVTATMSAGKSTMINAIFGKDFAITKKAACTSSIVEYIPMPVYHHNYLINRSDAEPVECSFADVRNHLETQSSTSSIIGYCASALSKSKLCIFDSPGINSSRHPEHKAITREALSRTEYDCIIYVIPVENYCSGDDDAHLKYILHHASYRNIIFAINMMDTCDVEDDNIDEIVCNIKSYLTDIGYSEPKVCPISAKAGLLFKQAILGQSLSQNAEASLCSLQSQFNGQDFDLSRFYRDCSIQEQDIVVSSNSMIERNKPGRDELLLSFLHTGLPQFERLLSDIIKEA